MKGSVAAVVGVFFFFIPFFARSQGTNAGNAVVFSGTGDYIYTGALDFPAPWTASMWVNRQNSLDLSSALFYSGSGALKLEQFSGTRQVGFSKFGVGDYLFGYIAPAGIWTHLTFVATTTNMVLYVNGQARATNGNSIALPLSQFGRATGDRLNASVDEVAVWNYARSATEISNSYAFHFFAPAPGLVLLWHFDEPTNAAPVVLDASGNGYNGYFSNNSGARDFDRADSHQQPGRDQPQRFRPGNFARCARCRRSNWGRGRHICSGAFGRDNLSDQFSGAALG